MQGNLSEAWGDIAGLEILAIDGATLDGSLPAAWAQKFTDLLVLELPHNAISASLPPGLPAHHP